MTAWRKIMHTHSIKAMTCGNHNKQEFKRYYSMVNRNAVQPVFAAYVVDPDHPACWRTSGSCLWGRSSSRSGPESSSCCSSSARRRPTCCVTFTDSGKICTCPVTFSFAQAVPRSHVNSGSQVGTIYVTPFLKNVIILLGSLLLWCLDIIKP